MSLGSLRTVVSKLGTPRAGGRSHQLPVRTAARHAGPCHSWRWAVSEWPRVEWRLGARHIEAGTAATSVSTNLKLKFQERHTPLRVRPCLCIDARATERPARRCVVSTVVGPVRLRPGASVRVGAPGRPGVHGPGAVLVAHCHVPAAWHRDPRLRALSRAGTQRARWSRSYAPSHRGRRAPDCQRADSDVRRAAPGPGLRLGL